jgi:hypothetical protein
MREPADIPPAHASGPWWRPVLVGVSVMAALVITQVTGVGVGIVLGAVAFVDTAGVVVAAMVRAHRHKESFRAAAVSLLVGEYGRWRLEERAYRPPDRADPGNRRRADRGAGRGARRGGE